MTRKVHLFFSLFSALRTLFWIQFYIMGGSKIFVIMNILKEYFENYRCLLSDISTCIRKLHDLEGSCEIYH